MNPYLFADGTFQAEIEVKRSRFIATLKGEVDANEAEAFVKEVKKKYPDARHNCYAYIADEYGNAVRFSDDGEPQGTAGAPILEVLKKRNVKKTAVVVTRYFGGILLGAAGLLSAYTDAVSNVLNVAKLREKTYCVDYSIKCDYSAYAALEKAARKKDISIVAVDYADGVNATLRVDEQKSADLPQTVTEATLGKAEIIKLGEGFAILAPSKEKI